jgi:hypothetical protein
MDASDPKDDLLSAKPAGSSEAEERSPQHETGLPAEEAPDIVAEEVELLRTQCQSLRELLMVSLLALILFTMGVNLFIAKQMRMVRTQLSEQRPVVSGLLAEFHKNREPGIRKFIGQLEAFATTNQNFQPILNRHRPVLGAFFSSAGPAQAPVLPVAPTQAPAARPSITAPKTQKP